MQVRLIASAKNGTSKVRLECSVREGLLPFLRSPPCVDPQSVHSNELGQGMGYLDKGGNWEACSGLASMAWPPDPIRKRPIVISKESGV